MTTLIFDTESDGFLAVLTRLHVLAFTDAKTQEKCVFRRYDGTPVMYVDPRTKELKSYQGPAVDTIEEGVRRLEQADVIVGHNSIAHDVPAIRKLFPWFQPPTVRDTMVMTRLMQPDIKDRDFRKWRQGTSARAAATREGKPDKFLIPGEVPTGIIGNHSLKAWGYRVGMHKGDYDADMRSAGLDPWAHWNPAMEEYCAGAAGSPGDIDITAVLWAGIVHDNPAPNAVELEHDITDLTTVMEHNGFPFDQAAAQRLGGSLASDLQSLEDAARPVFGKWAAPTKRRWVKPAWDDPDGINDKKFHEQLRAADAGTKVLRQKYFRPRSEFGEDLSRMIWGDVVVPKKRMRVRSKVPEELCTPEGAYTIRDPEAPYCPMEMKEFNPGSRDQIIERFSTIHSWAPMEFTEKGNPSVNDEVLRGLAHTIPVAAVCAEVFFVKKILGYVQTGNESWLKHYNEATGCIHGHINTGGTVSGRCSHVAPNLGQIPAVVEADVHKKDGSVNPLVLGDDGDLDPRCYVDGIGSALKKKIVLLGRRGEYGWECRELFGVQYWNEMQKIQTGVDPDWVQIGIDLKGIELRCLAEECAEFDGGELMEVVLQGDPHQYNKDKTGLDNRDRAKRCLYCLMYGGGDYKLGITAYPDLTTQVGQATGAGRHIRAQFMEGLPALKRAIDKAQREAERGYLIGLDGRRLFCRSPHSALNLRLQSNAALVAKRWAVLTEWYALDAGLDHGWGRDFVMLQFIHDELQNGARRDVAAEFARLSIKAAQDAGIDFALRVPVDADAKFGMNWAECH